MLFYCFALAWFAREYSGKEFPERNVAKLLEVFDVQKIRGVVPLSHSTNTASYYSFYDEFPECRYSALDQGRCFTCWAMAVSSVVSHRFCRLMKKRIVLHPFHPIYCTPEKRGCNLGGHEHLAWRYAEYSGLVRATSGKNLSCDVPKNTRRYKIQYGSVKTFVGEDEIREEILKNGPVTGLIYLTEDLYSYGGGVYENRNVAVYDQLHAVEIIGWGNDFGTPYWLVQNSFGNDWGENGTMKILRGRNELGIETYATAGIPLLTMES